MASNKRLIAAGAAAAGGGFFTPIAFTGTGQSNSITGVGFQPDLMILKSRSFADNWYIQNSLRGASKRQYINTTDAEFSSDTNRVTSFDSDGFTLGSDNSTNQLNQTFITYSFKAGGTPNTFSIDGTGYGTASAAGLDGGATNPSSATVNTTSGFGIYTVSYPQNAVNRTINHGLGVKPSFVIWKSYSGAFNTYFKFQYPGGAFYNMAMNTSDAATSTSAQFDSSNIDLKITNGAHDVTGYAFCDVSGVQKFGGYTASNSWGTSVSVDVGFEPRFVMVKSVDNSGGWLILDSLRNSGGYLDRLQTQSTAADDTTDTSCTFSGNTFNITFGSTGNQGTPNVSRYIYWAIA